jgi:hypothetical protein
MSNDYTIRSGDYDYELIEFELESEDTPNKTSIVADDSNEDSTISRDADGIPLGDSLEEIKLRSEIIRDFFHKWKELHPEQMVYNECLKENILVRNVTLIEAREHSSKSYKSTRAFLQMDEVLAKAEMVGETMPKPNDKNQMPFERIYVMRYDTEDLGVVKLTLGVRKRTREKIQYGISVPPSGQSLMPPKGKSKANNKKKKHP